MTYDDTRFSVMFRRFGGWARILLSADFLLAAIAAGACGGVISYTNIARKFITSTNVGFVAISAAMIATSLGGLAIIASISDPEFVKFAKGTEVGDSNVYDNIIFIFWYAALVSFFSLVADISGGLVVAILHVPLLTRTVATGILFLLFYSIGIVVELLGTVSRWGFYRGLWIHEGKPPPPKQDATQVQLPPVRSPHDSD